MWFHRVLICLVLILPIKANPPDGYELFWFDEFKSDKLDLSKWNYYDTGKRRNAINTPDAVSVKDGSLVISTYTENDVHYTGMVSTKGIFETRYGYWEARIKFSDAPGTFSDFWLHSRNIGKPWYDPKNAGVEIDIVEHREIDNDWNTISGINSINLHWGDYEEHHQWDGTETYDFNIGNGYHLFGLEWTPTFYKFYIDDILVWTHMSVISDAYQFVIFSTEIDHMEWSGPVPRYGYGNKKNSSTKMHVDYFRYYKPIQQFKTR